MRILNLGCGTTTSDRPEVVNIDWSIYLRLKRNPILRILARPFLSRERKRRLDELPANVLVHDLSKGIPFADGSADAVYASHLLEHLDRDVAEKFAGEILRVLRPGGVVRLVVPDLERLCRRYLLHVERCERDAGEIPLHDDYVARMYEQSVRREGAGATHQRGLRRLADRILVGDARRRGETHQWMYDRFNLRALLDRVGFLAATPVDSRASSIPDWPALLLDHDELGEERHANSLYMEASAPR